MTGYCVNESTSAMSEVIPENNTDYHIRKLINRDIVYYLLLSDVNNKKSTKYFIFLAPTQFPMK